jgi:superfamily II DNA helicase RecQ
VKRVYIDEAQDFIIGHPDRVPVYEGFAGITALLKFPRIYLTGTLPPQLLKQFCRKTESPDNIHVIRASTDRPELGYNAILLDPQNSGINIVTSAYTLAVALRTLLKTHEKILVFFETVENVEYFCSKDQRTTAKYHARMSEPLKKDSLNKWDAGSMKILAATTAVAYGLDRPDVRFVIACGIGHGMITLVQELGRGGRDGKFAHTFTMDDQSISYISSKQDETLRSAASAFLHSTSICKRQLILAVMDGFSHTCLEDKFCNPCDICYPNSIMKRFAMEAVVDNKIPAPARVPTHPFDLSPLPSISSQSSSCISSSGSFMFSAEMAEELDRVESRLIAQKGKGKEREREDASDPVYKDLPCP